MILADVGCWVVAMRLTTRKLWRVLVTVFLAGQLIFHLSAVAGLGWPYRGPQFVLVLVMTWHYFAVGVLLPLGAACACAWLIRLFLSRKPGPQSPAPPPESANTQTRREFIGSAVALAPVLFSVGTAGAGFAQLNTLRVRKLTLPISALPRALDGMTIVHLSDIHVGMLSCDHVLREMVNKTNALKPDLILMTGDLIDLELSDLNTGIELAKAMESRHGLYMVEGNHDLAQDGGEFQQRVKAAGIPLLLDEAPLTKVRGYPVQLFGLRWMLGLARASTGGLDHALALQLRMLLRQREAEAFPILLAHHPHAFDAAFRAGLPLTLSGHTHGGQWMLNRQLGVGPIMFRYWSGLYTRANSHLVVSNGVGNVFPLRINAPTELVHLTLRSETRA